MHHQLVHFPIAFLLAAAVAQIIHGRKPSSEAQLVRNVLLYAGAAFAAAAAISGMIMSIGFTQYADEYFYPHAILGYATFFLSVGGALSLKKGRIKAAIILLYLAAIQVSVAGYFGGFLGHPPS